MATSQGYRCEFVEVVPEDLYCRKCSLVARRLTITDCCGESFCHNCIAGPQLQKQPCPACGENNFTTLKQVKNQRRISQLMVYCSMKERGCGWSGTLDQLDTHLDPHQDNCQYVDTKCPLNCLKTIPKNNMDDHLAQHCVKRAYVCRHCSFKATYEEIVDTHLPQCKYVPLDCPNRCGATFERDFLEDHMKMCRLEEVECELRGVGCGGRFLREDQEEHARQNGQKHLTLTASLAMETKEQLQQKLLELDQIHKEEEEKLKKKIEEQAKNMVEQEKKLVKQDQKLKQQEKKLEELELKLSIQEREYKEGDQKLKVEVEENTKALNDQQRRHEAETHTSNKTIEDLKHKLTVFEQNHQGKIEAISKKLQELEDDILEATVRSDRNKTLISQLSAITPLNRRFELTSFSFEKEKDKYSNWKSPAMYSHPWGYKFCIGVDANGCNVGHGKSIYVDLWAMRGEFDEQLKWPVRVTFCVELVNQKGGDSAQCSGTWTWQKPSKPWQHLGPLFRITGGFLEHSKLVNFLNNDTLYFYVSDVHLWSLGES